MVYYLPSWSESGGGAGSTFAHHYLVLASELAPLHQAPHPFLDFTGHIWRLLRCIPRSPTSQMPLCANLPAHRPCVLPSSTDQTPFLTSLLACYLVSAHASCIGTLWPPFFKQLDTTSCQLVGVLLCALILVHMSCIGTSWPPVLNSDLLDTTSRQLINLLVHPLGPTMAHCLCCCFVPLLCYSLIIHVTTTQPVYYSCL
jgi:hypothetical protein